MEQKSHHKTRSRRKNRQKAPTAPQGRTAHQSLRFRVPLFPTRFKKQLMYSEVGLQVTGTGGLVGNYFFSANGMFDPNVTGTGHQPMGFDQMMLMYEQYTVVSSKITLTANNNSASSITSDCALYLSPDTTSITDASRLIENGYIVWKALYPINVSGSIAVLSLNCNIPAYFGRNSNKRAIVDDTLLYGTAAANPTEQVYFVVAAYDGASAANNVAVIFRVEIEYEAIFWEPRKLTQS